MKVVVELKSTLVDSPRVAQVRAYSTLNPQRMIIMFAPMNLGLRKNLGTLG